jgi:hypothetical protein
MRIDRLHRRLLSAPLLALVIACGAAPTPAPTPASAPAIPSAAPAVYTTYPLGAKYLGEHEGKSASGHTVRYFNAEERIAHTLHACGGKLCDPQGKPLDPEVATHPKRSGTLLYAMTGDGTLLGSFDAELHVVHHSTLNAGGPVACAGEMMLIEGEVMEIDNTSGHYTPPAEALDQVVTQLRKLGVDLSRTKINYFGMPDRKPAAP